MKLIFTGNGANGIERYNKHPNTNRNDTRRKVTPKKRNLYSSLAQPVIFDTTLTGLTLDQKRAKHGSVLNFSDGSLRRRSSIDQSNKSKSSYSSKGKQSTQPKKTLGMTLKNL